MHLGFDPIAEARRNWEGHGWRAPEAMVAATSIARAHQVVLAQIDAALAPLGLTFSRFEALALLHFTRRGSLPDGQGGHPPAGAPGQRHQHRSAGSSATGWCAA